MKRTGELAQKLKQQVGADTASANAISRAGHAVGHPISVTSLCRWVERGYIPARRRMTGGPLVLAVEDVARVIEGVKVGGVR